MKNEQINSLKQLFTAAKQKKEDRKTSFWIYAAWTDQILLDHWDFERYHSFFTEEKQETLLELRIFSEIAEYKAVRSSIGKGMRYRIQEDADETLAEKWFDERQYLDIHTGMTVKQSGTQYLVRTTTGSGPYTVPLSDLTDARIVVRNYLNYYETTGQAYVEDWRLVRLEGGRGDGTK